jgi:hypothetical protein
MLNTKKFYFIFIAMIYENILEEEVLNLMIEAVVHETTNFPCLMVPKYQSYPTMHRKYKYYPFWQIFQHRLLEIAKEVGGKEYRIHSCWFNACTEESNFDWHAHHGYDLTCVFYVHNCNDNGTLIRQDNTIIQTPAKDNSLSFMQCGVEHKVPNWNGRDRYSVAVQLSIS